MQPTQYESSIERPINSIFTGEPLPPVAACRVLDASHWWCGIGLPACFLYSPCAAADFERIVVPAGCRWSLPTARSNCCAHCRTPQHPLVTLCCPAPPPPPEGNFIRVKKVAAYQFTMAAASGLGCNETLFAAWKNETGLDEGAYQGEGC